MADTTSGNVLLASRVFSQKMPAANGVVTLFRSTDLYGDGSFATKFSRYMVSIHSSHDSAASGLTFQASVDGITWLTVETAVTYLTANGLSTYDWLVKMPHLLIQYTNSNNTLTAWQVAVYGVANRGGS